MSRPDPRMVPRQPMAHAQGQIAWTGGGSRAADPRILFEEDAINLDTLHHLIETSEVLSEGRIDPFGSGKRFFGSTVITIDLAQVQLVEEPDEVMAEALVNVLETDSRAHRVIEDRIFREIARLLGTQTSIDFEAQTSTVRSGLVLRISSDFDSAIAREEAILQ